jgi:hypothetical protein
MLMPEGIDIIIISVTAVEFDVLAQSYGTTYLVRYVPHTTCGSISPCNDTALEREHSPVCSGDTTNTQIRPFLKKGTRRATAQ